MSRIHSPVNLIELLGMQHLDWVEGDRGANGYMNRLYYDHISILYNGRADMGVCLEMSGQGCRVFEEYGTGDFSSLFRVVFSESPDDIHLTRLDVAFDDHTGLLDMPTLVADTQAFYFDDNHKAYPRFFVSKFRQREVDWYHKDGDERPSWSVYHGRKASEAMIRIYDKAAERGFFDRHWVRVEMQLRDDRAMEFARQLDQGFLVGDLFRGSVYNYLRYVDDPGCDSNKRRWPMKQYWSDFLEDAERIRLYKKLGIEYNMVNLENFLFGTCGSAAYTYAQIMGQSMFWKQIAEARRGKELPPKYKQLIDQFKQWRRQEEE